MRWSSSLAMAIGPRAVRQEASHAELHVAKKGGCELAEREAVGVVGGGAPDLAGPTVGGGNAGSAARVAVQQAERLELASCSARP